MTGESASPDPSDPCAREERVRGGAQLFERSADFLLVLDGAVEIHEEGGDGRPAVLAAHQARRSTGEPGLLADRETGAAAARPIRSLFAMIGAEPDAGWIEDCLLLDGKGFVVTGRDGAGRAPPSPFATARPGVLAVDGVRAGSVERAAPGVGERAVVVAALHRFLAPGTA